MLVSLCYLVLRWLLQLVVLRVRSDEWKELEIVVLRHELTSFGASPAARRSQPVTGCSLPLPADFCLGRAGRPSSSHLRPSFAGIGAWLRSGGPTRIRLVARPCGVRFEHWCFVSRERTRGGATNGLSAS